MRNGFIGFLFGDGKRPLDRVIDKFCNECGCEIVMRVSKPRNYDSETGMVFCWMFSQICKNNHVYSMPVYRVRGIDESDFERLHIEMVN